jgi:hypothetical protein
MTDHHEFERSRFEYLPGSEYGGSTGAKGLLVALVAIVLFFAALIMFAENPVVTGDGDGTAIENSGQPADGDSATDPAIKPVE